jgi:hypothetical protein
VARYPLDEHLELGVLTTGTFEGHVDERVSERWFGRAFERLVRTHDLTVVDSPPLLAVADTATIAGYTDAVVLIVREGSPLGDLERVLQRLRFAGQRLVGYVYLSPTALDDTSFDYGLVRQKAWQSLGTRPPSVEERPPVEPAPTPVIATTDEAETEGHPTAHERPTGAQESSTAEGPPTPVQVAEPQGAPVAQQPPPPVQAPEPQGAPVAQQPPPPLQAPEPQGAPVAQQPPPPVQAPEPQGAPVAQQPPPPVQAPEPQHPPTAEQLPAPIAAPAPVATPTGDQRRASAGTTATEQTATAEENVNDVAERLRGLLSKRDPRAGSATIAPASPAGPQRLRGVLAGRDEDEVVADGQRAEPHTEMGRREHLG